MTSCLTDLTVSDASRLLDKRELLPSELLEAHLQRIAALDPLLACFVQQTPERALTEAIEADKRVIAGTRKCPLDGIPYGLKDIFDVAGIRTTACSRHLAGNIATADSTCAARLSHAGGVLLGKLTTYEMATGGPSFDLPWPPARNPWSLDHTTGGSSSGPAAAVAARMCPFALGSDTGGSTRVPAAYCGVVGLKPTFGRISKAGVLPLSESWDTVGILCRTVEDAALILHSIAGHDPTDPTSVDHPVDDYATELHGEIRRLRIGLVEGFHIGVQGTSEDVLTATETALEVFRAAGADIREVALSPLEDFGACLRIMLLTEVFDLYESDLIGELDRFGEVFRYCLLPGLLVRGVDYVRAAKFRRLLANEILAAFDTVDVLVTPTSFGPAPALKSMALADHFRPSLAGPFNVSGVPALSMCIGFDAKGLPLGMQIAGRPFDEATILRAAHAYQRETEWHTGRPPIRGAESESASPAPRISDWIPRNGVPHLKLQAYAKACIQRAGLSLSERQVAQLCEAAELVLDMMNRLPNDPSHGY